VLILTDWPEIGKMDLAQLKKSMKCPIVIDGRNVFQPARMAEHGFVYHSIGRQPVTHARKGRKPRAT